jgi:hypothetical protein
MNSTDLHGLDPRGVSNLQTGQPRGHTEHYAQPPIRVRAAKWVLAAIRAHWPLPNHVPGKAERDACSLEQPPVRILPPIICIGIDNRQA